MKLKKIVQRIATFTVVLGLSLTLGLVLTSRSAHAVLYYGWDQLNTTTSNDESILWQYSSASDLSTNTNNVLVGPVPPQTGSYTFEDIASDGTFFYGWDQQFASLWQYSSASDLSTNTNASLLGSSGSSAIDAIASDGTFFYGWDQQLTSLWQYSSAADLSTNMNAVLLGNTGDSTIDAIASDGVFLYGWDQKGNFSDQSILWQYSSAANLATGTGAVQVGNTGSHTFEGIAIGVPASEPIPEPTTIALLGIGLAGLGGMFLRRRRKKIAD